MVEYIWITRLYKQINLIINIYSTKELYEHNFYDFVNLLRRIGYFYVAADFSKFALGWF